MTRKTRQVETKLLSEYILATYPKYTTMFDQGLGVAPPELVSKYGLSKALALYSPARPHVDAIVLLPRYFLLIEAKVWEVIAGLGKLPLYAALVHITPELKQYEPREVIMELVVARINPNLEAMAGSQKVTVKLFTPDWVKQVIHDRDNYQTPEYRARREDILRTREQLGLE